MKRKVFIVDGDPAALESVSAALVGAGFEVACARDGFEALRDLNKFRPDALVADVDLPKLDGLDLVRAIRSQPETSQLPVVFVSLKTDRETLLEARKLGAKKFLAKPFDIENLVECLSSFF